MKTLTCLALSLLLSLTLMTACGDGDESSGIIEPPAPVVNPPTLPPVTTPPTSPPIEQPTVEEANIDLLANATGASSEAIKSAAKTYGVNLSLDLTLNSALLKMIVKITPSLATKVSTIQTNNLAGQTFMNADNVNVVTSYNQELADILSSLFPGVTFRAPTDEDLKLKSTSKKPINFFVYLIVKALMSTTYYVDNECKGFYHFGDPGHPQAGDVAYLECDAVFVD